MAESRSLVARLLDTPDLANIVPRLQPEVLHRVIQVCGLEDCAEFVALATPAQLGRILDVDLWRPRDSGADDVFDADRFGVWLEVLMQAGPDVAADKLMGLDIELVIAGCASHVAVFDCSAVSSYTTLDGEEMPGRTMNRGPVAEIGGYVIEARRTAAFDTIVDLLAHLDAERANYFQRLMRGCVALSDGPREEDGCHDLLDDAGQDMFDLGCEREARREREGYVAPAQAHAFLLGARDLHLAGDRPATNAIATASSRSVASAIAGDGDEPGDTDMRSSAPIADALTDLEADGATAVVELLRDAGVLGAEPRALLGAHDSDDEHLSLLRAHLSLHGSGGEELAFLANALAAGCTIQGRAFTPREGADGAAATCNLGLENWPSSWSEPDLITAFQVGWAVLHRDVGLSAAQRLIDVLGDIRCSDREIQLRLDGLRRDLTSAVAGREPWRARPAMDALLMLDAAAWAGLLALIDACPVVHAVVTAPRTCRTINPTDFTFVSQNRQIAAVRAFLESLPTALTA